MLLRQSLPFLQQLQQQYEVEKKLYSIGAYTEQCMSPIPFYLQFKHLSPEQIQNMPAVLRLMDRFPRELEEIPKEIPDRVYTAELKFLDEIEFVPKDKLLFVGATDLSTTSSNTISNGNGTQHQQESNSTTSTNNTGTHSPSPASQQSQKTGILSSEQFQKLFSKSLKQQLQPTQELSPLIKHLDVIDPSHPDAQTIIHFQPQALAEIVNVNPKLACELLIKLDTFKEYLEFPLDHYFSVLANMSTSLGPMETINLISVKQKQLKRIILPKQYVLDYIINCLSSIEKQSNNHEDNSTIQRQVRLFCVFFQSLLRNDVITKPSHPEEQEETLLLQVRQFAFHYTKLKEAQQLYSQLGMV